MYKFLTDSYVFSINTIVKHVDAGLKFPQSVLLEDTVFYPQGGGQPSDTGKISCSGSVFNVKFVRWDAETNQAFHEGEFETGIFKVGDKVEARIDQEQRITNMKCHSAGHILGDAVDSLNLGIKCQKSYHFADGAYLEYTGTLETSKEELIERIDALVFDVVSKSLPIKVYFKLPSELSELEKDNVSEKVLESNQPIRFVQVEGYPACPCGGTHLRNTSELKNISIRKINTAKKKIKFCYRFE